MADVNYINPMALKPEIGWAPKNALAGMMYQQNDQDYRTMFDQQQRMQAMAEEEKRMRLEAARKDVPLNDLLRSNKMSFAQGEAPFQGQLGATGAQAGINENQIKASPERLKAAIAQFASQADDATWQRLQKPMEFMGMALGPAIQMMQQGNQMGAMQFMQQQVGRAKQMGLDIPPDIMNPQSWPAYYQFALEAPKHRQKMQEINETGRFGNDRAEIQAQNANYRTQITNASNERIAGINAGSRERAAASRATTGRNSKFSRDNKINELADQLQDTIEAGGDPTRHVNQMTFQLQREFEEQHKNDFLLHQQPEKYKAKLRGYVEGKMSALGVTVRPEGEQQKRPQASPTQPQSSGGKPPLESFLR